MTEPQRYYRTQACAKDRHGECGWYGYDAETDTPCDCPCRCHEMIAS